MITYRVRLDVPRELVLFVSRLLARHRNHDDLGWPDRLLGDAVNRLADLGPSLFGVGTDDNRSLQVQVGRLTLRRDLPS